MAYNAMPIRVFTTLATPALVVWAEDTGVSEYYCVIVTGRQRYNVPFSATLSGEDGCVHYGHR
jgi:hypothetical protein